MVARTGEVGYDRLQHFIGAGLWDSAPLGHIVGPGRRAGRRRQDMADHRRYRVAEEGDGIRRRGATICIGAGQECELPDARIGDAGVARSTDDAGLACSCRKAERATRHA